VKFKIQDGEANTWNLSIGFPLANPTAAT